MGFLCSLNSGACCAALSNVFEDINGQSDCKNDVHG